ncbi:MAG TPA: peptidylprolyl isomerase [Verrucomicrobiae bacterium]|jgi:cyclophilin family peptidyl-prolyl cis-trans isomerase
MQQFRTVCFLAVLVCSFARVDAGTLVQFRTALGDIEVELYDQDKPVTVKNFLNYLNSGLYQNEFAHRLAQGFVLQGGGYTLTSNTIYSIPTNAPIVDEFGVGHQYSNVYGTIAMAKLGGFTNSATSQWYFNLANNSSLDAADTNDLFCVFGHVISGTNVLNTFNKFVNWNSLPAPSPTNLVLNGYYAAPLNTLPVLSSNFPPTTNSFVFVDISLMQIGIQTVGASKQISWNSATGLTNMVEYTTNFSTWNTLVTTNGTGARMTVTDPAAVPNRFYRVQVTY